AETRDAHGRTLPRAAKGRGIVWSAGGAESGGGANSFGDADQTDIGGVFRGPGGGGPGASVRGRGAREMRNVLTVAANTFREAVRDRVLYNLVVFALLIITAAIFVGQISIGIEQSIIVSLGLTAISVIGLFIAVFIGVGLVSKEMDKRTLYALLAKPVERWEFLLGKFCGLVMTLTVNTSAMAVGLYLALWTAKHTLEKSDIWILVAVYLILLKLALIVALALLFSCFTTPFLAILFTAGIYVAGLFAGDLRTMKAVDLTPATMKLLKGISYLLPNFENFNVMGAVAHGRAVPGALVAHATLYAAVYGAVVLIAAAAIFSRRNLK